MALTIVAACAFGAHVFLWLRLPKSATQVDVPMGDTVLEGSAG